jgi:hypothetical protein
LNWKGGDKKKPKEIIKDYFEHLYSHTLENLEQMDKFIDTYINLLNRSIICNETEAAIKKSPKKEKSGT